MTRTTVKRSPYKVGQVLNHHTMTEIVKGRPIPSCAGFTVTFVERLGHASGGYIIGLQGRRFLHCYFPVFPQEDSQTIPYRFPLLYR